MKTEKKRTSVVPPVESPGQMASLEPMQASVPERMMLAAKALIAGNGPENITVRNICDASGANVNAVYYYYGSKEALIKDALIALMEPVNVKRKEMLEEARKRYGEKPIPMKVILEALIRPALSGARTHDGGRIYIRTEQHLRSVPDSEYSRHVSENLDHYAQIFIDSMAQALPELTRGEIVWRYEFIRGAVLHQLGNCDPLSTKFQVLSGGKEMMDLEDDELILVELMQVAMSGLGAPSTSAPRRRSVRRLKSANSS
jgi:AcrR family transcriptional regulator